MRLNSTFPQEAMLASDDQSEDERSNRFTNLVENRDVVNMTFIFYPLHLIISLGQMALGSHSQLFAELAESLKKFI